MYSKRSILIIPIAVNTVIFFFLSVLHFYWAFGGRLWYDDVLPTSANGMNKLIPGTTTTFVIAFLLMVFALVTAGNLGLFDRYIKRTYLRNSTLIIAVIFFLRAIGDFKFTGFFKIVKWTKFGVNDTQIFSPLCLLIAVFSLLIYIFSRKMYNIFVL